MTSEAVTSLKIADLQLRVEKLEKEIADMKRVPYKPYYTVDEYAELLSVSSQTIYNKIKKGDIPVKRVGKILRIPAQVNS